MASEIRLEKAGAAQAAVLAAMFGILALALVNLGTEASENFKNSVQGIGKLCIPGAEGIGPYSGKEVISFFVWLLSWLLLHAILRGREWNNNAVATTFLIGMAAATTLVWPPATHLAVSLIK